MRGGGLLTLGQRGYSTKVRTKLKNIAKAYNPTMFEEKVGKKWKDRVRSSEVDGSDTSMEDARTTFRMVLPPPNVTGKLHLGHALTVAIQDTIYRLKTMTGSPVEWIPGFDHAGIATHSVVTRKIQKSSKTAGAGAGPIKMHPSLLQKELQDYAQFNRENIRKQLDMLGALLDWNREYYTLDESHSEVVKEAFIQLFETGVIRRGIGIVNWSYALQSSIADIEVQEIDFTGRTSLRVPGYDQPVEFGLLYYFGYPLVHSDHKLIVATSRPETMFGDMAVAVHPDDIKFQPLIGQHVLHPINGKVLPIIADSRVKINFGTGAVKITPAHDKLDFAIGTDNNLQPVQIFTPDGNLNENCGNFEGLGRFTARSKVIDYLTDTGSLLEVADYQGTVGICSRTQDVIEPIILPHWFFRTRETTDMLISAINKDQFIIRPESCQKHFLGQIAHAHDWCLSRQIQWGHLIPAFYHKSFPDKWVAAHSKGGAKDKFEKLIEIPVSTDDVVQDTDVLDTWFSSALVPLSVSDWPETNDFKEISLMETGHDILLFWVWRMVMMNLALVEKFPFRSVLLHGVVVDHYGRKMSKSRGNVIDPMHVIFGKSVEELKRESQVSLDNGELDQEEYDLRLVALKKEYPAGLPACGADALRYALLGQDIYDQNLTIRVAYLENCKHFCNKLWQAMRLYLHYCEEIAELPVEISKPVETTIISFPDRWILSALYEFSKTYEENIRVCKFHLVTEAIRTFFYAQYCDVYLELVKNDLQHNENTEQHLLVMRYAFCTALKLAHPFLPFVTEEIWSVMTEGKTGLLIDATLPIPLHLEEFRNDKSYQDMNKALRIVKEIRSLRSTYFPASKEVPNFYVETHEEDSELASVSDSIETLTKTSVHFANLGRFIQSDFVGVVFDLEEGRSCRVCVARNEITSMPSVKGDSKLSKLKAKRDKLKQQFEDPEFQEKATQETKDRLRKRVQLLEKKIYESNPSPGSEKI